MATTIIAPTDRRSIAALRRASAGGYSSKLFKETVPRGKTKGYPNHKCCGNKPARFDATTSEPANQPACQAASQPASLLGFLIAVGRSEESVAAPLPGRGEAGPMASVSLAHRRPVPPSLSRWPVAGVRQLCLLRKLTAASPKSVWQKWCHAFFCPFPE